jgi:hypothetical protein
VTIAAVIDVSHAMGAFYLATLHPTGRNLIFYKGLLIFVPTGYPLGQEDMVVPPVGDGGEIGD